MDIIQRNFFNLLASAAPNKNMPLEPMSNFKWQRLIELVKGQKVERLALLGLNNLQNNQRANIPENDIRAAAYAVSSEKSEKPGVCWDSMSPILQPPHLSNPLLDRRLRKIQQNERHEIDASIVTVDLLNIIVHNAELILNRGISLNGIMQLGNFLRTKGGEVDFVKLDNWLAKLHLTRFAQLEGSILISIFDFEQEEIPFVKTVEPKAYELTLRTISHAATDSAKEWHFRQRQAGFVENNSKVLRRNLRRSVRYMPFSPIETTSNFIRNFARSLSEIEE